MHAYGSRLVGGWRVGGGGGGGGGVYVFNIQVYKITSWSSLILDLVECYDNQKPS